jgi:protein-L-isoaspartate(D-aspartate) O-methyltransferase
MAGNRDKNESASESRFATGCRTMIEKHLKGREIHSRQVLDAMRRVKRHAFVPQALLDDAYGDFPLPLGYGQTISQPYIVALMTQLGLGSSTTRPLRVLDIGTGSGYQAAVLAEVAEQVYSVEIIPELADSARETLKNQGYGNITISCSDGHQGWREHAPFDFIVVAAAPSAVPTALKDQLMPGGRLVIPVGEHYQELITVTQTEVGQFATETIIPVRFVPMMGKARAK